jgi:hypothetical protein
MPLISFIRRRPASLPPLAKAPVAPTRPVLIEWKDEAGAKVWQQTHLELDRLRGLTAVVRQRPPQDTVALVRETASSYPVVVIAANMVDGGFELELDYFSEGRRREHRAAISGPATFKPEGLTEMRVEVLNVSSGGMQLFSTFSVPEGNLARISGTDTERLCLVRSCVATPGGYLMGLQFWGETRRERNYGDD